MQTSERRKGPGIAAFITVLSLGLLGSASCHRPGALEAADTAGGEGGESSSTPPPAEGYVDLTLEIDREGEVTVVRAGEVAGVPVVSDQVVGDYAVEVVLGERTLYLESISDPFTGHSFGGPADEERGHHVEALERATVRAKIPAAHLDQIEPQVIVRLLRIREAGTLYRLDAATLEELRHQDRVETVAEVSGEELGRGVRVLQQPR